MKKQNGQQTEYFKMKFPKTIYALCIAILLLCGAGICVSLYQTIRFGLKGLSDYLKYPALILIALFCIAVVLSILIKSQYIVDNERLVTQFGFIKSKCSISEITAIVLDTDVKKLTVYLGEQLNVLTVEPEWNERLVRALLDKNPNIDYSFTMAENKPQNKED